MKKKIRTLSRAFLIFSIFLSTNLHAEITPCFTPQEKCLPLILQEIDDAKAKVWLQGYTFTSTPIANALIKAKNRGLDVQIILDKSQINQKHAVAHELQKADIPAYIDTTKGIAHSKIIIADNTVLTGSYNWTNSAEARNCENLLIIKNEEKTMTKYEQNFLARKAQATDFNSSGK